MITMRQLSMWLRVGLSESPHLGLLLTVIPSQRGISLATPQLAASGGWSRYFPHPSPPPHVACEGGRIIFLNRKFEIKKLISLLHRHGGGGLGWGK